MSLTGISVEQGRVRLRHGLLRAQQTSAGRGWTRVGLVATTALLLGGDDVRVDVCVGPGARLDLFDVAGTVAYDGRGAASSWRARVAVGPGAMLRWSGEPFIVSDGADVLRSLAVEADPTATVVMRESLVLGRSGQVGGRLRNQTTIGVGDSRVLIEDQVLDPGGVRTLPGVLGTQRVIDTITRLGASDLQVLPEGTARFHLLRDSGTITRFLGTELADSPLGLAFAEVGQSTAEVGTE